ncbi:hypothetical protein [Glycomyces sp. NPDC047010]|uniref:hypothetical protein n=1 Tax=Glycomyces sp. NPDC047010 TaxID=3155023 RepID=UPI0033D568C1
MQTIHAALAAAEGDSESGAALGAILLGLLLFVGLGVVLVKTMGGKKDDPED